MKADTQGGESPPEAVDKVGSPENQEQVAALPRR